MPIITTILGVYAANTPSNASKLGGSGRFLQAFLLSTHCLSADGLPTILHVTRIDVGIAGSHDDAAL